LNNWLHNLEVRKRTEESLRESEARCLELFENANIAIFRAELDGRILDVNPEFARIFGYDSPQQVKEMVSRADEFFADQEHRAELVQRLRQGERVLSAEGLYRRMDGSTFIGTLSLRAEKDDHGNIAHIEGFIEDITEHRQADEALRKSEEKFRTLAQFTHDWEYWTDLEYNYLYISPSVERITGYRIREFLEDRGASCSDMKKVPIPAPCRERQGALRSLTVLPFFLMKSVNCPSSFRQSSSGCSRAASSNVWGVLTPSV
jgi:PAS domain S-box-containing protein